MRYEETGKVTFASRKELVYQCEALKAELSRFSVEEYPRETCQIAKLLYCLANYIGEELWTILGRPGSLFTQPWPTADPAALRREAVEIVVQVDGRVRTRLTVEVGAPEQSIREAALAEDKVRPWIDGRQVAKVVVVPGRLVNIVTSS